MLTSSSPTFRRLTGGRKSLTKKQRRAIYAVRKASPSGGGKRGQGANRLDDPAAVATTEGQSEAAGGEAADDFWLSRGGTASFYSRQQHRGNENTTSDPAGGEAEVAGEFGIGEVVSELQTPEGCRPFEMGKRYSTVVRLVEAPHV